MADDPLFTSLGPTDVAGPRQVARVINQLLTVMQVYGSFLDALDDRIALIEELLELDDPPRAMVDTPDIANYEEATT